MVKQKIQLFFSTALLMTFLSAAQANDVYRKKEFSISLPSGWVEIPREALDNFENHIAAMFPDVPRQHYAYAFQLPKKKKWFEYPYILIQINNRGKLPVKMFRKLESFSAQEALDKHKKDLSSVISSIKAGKMYYDRQLNIIWLRMESKVVNIGLVTGLSGIVPTQDGVIQVSGYSRKDKYPVFGPIFKDSIISLTLKPELVYKPRWDASTPYDDSAFDWVGIGEKALLGSLFAGLIVFLYAQYKKKNNSA